MAGEGIVVAFAGAIGSGKSNLSRHVAGLLGCPRVSFGDYIRGIAEANHMDSSDRGVLQRLGQALVVSNAEDFARKVLATRPDWQPGQNLVIDGLRHVEVRQVLFTLVRPSILKLVFLSIDETSRRQRAQRDKEIPQPQLIRYDQDITEAQIPRILPSYADVVVDSTLPVDIAAREVLSRLGLQVPMVAAE